MNVTEWLTTATSSLQQSGVTSARLDAELLLAHALKVDRTWLHAHSDDPLSADIQSQADKLLQRRLTREPISYITGYKEFYGREFTVTPDVLVPRPESEVMIELLKTLPAIQEPHTIDIGTGSGCLGITAKLELPQLDMTLADVSQAALSIARQNVTIHNAKVTVTECYLLLGLKPPRHRFHFILANLPYVDREWDTPPELDHEPTLALYAENHGLKLIIELLDQTPDYLKTDGYILLEADPQQHEAIISRGQQNGLQLETVRDYIVVLKKS